LRVFREGSGNLTECRCPWQRGRVHTQFGRRFQSSPQPAENDESNVSTTPWGKGLIIRMAEQELIEKIREIVERIAAEKNLPGAPVMADTLLLGPALGIDSLDLAAIVVELSETTGKDPFRSGFIEFRTVGELSRLYAGENGE
jgi:acyl carrier protein